MVAERHRLGRLEMGEARHDARGMLLGARHQRALQRGQALRRRRRSRRAPRAGNRSRPGRCASGRCAAAPPPGRSARRGGARHACGCPRAPHPRRRRPLSYSSSIRSSPSSIASASSWATMPWAASMAIWTRLAAMSCRQSRLSKPIEAFISRISAEGPSANRPPHMALESLILAACDRLSPRPPDRPSRWPDAIGKRRQAPQGEAPASRQCRGAGASPIRPAGSTAAMPARRRPTSRSRTARGGRSTSRCSAAGRCWSISGRPGAGPASSRCRRSTRSPRARARALQVVAISQDMDGRQKVTDFFAARSFTRLEPYLDPRDGR